MNTTSQVKPVPKQTSDWSVTPVEIPAASSILGLYQSPNLADAYAVKLPVGMVANPEQLARIVFAQQPAWATALMKIRDVIVAGFGLKTAAQLTAVDEAGRAGRVGIFKIYKVADQEIVLGEDDKHLDFRISLLCDAPSVHAHERRRLVLSTVVQCHNRLGRTYIMLIAPFHRLIVQASLRRAAKMGWKQAAGT